MKIALIHYRLIQKGGLESRFINYMNYCAKAGYDTTLILSRRDPSIPIPDSVKIIHIDISRVPKPVRMYFFDQRLRRVMKENSFDYSLSLGRTSHQDAVICPGNHIGYMKAMGEKIYSPIDLLNIHLDRKAFKRSAKIYAASSMMKDELIHYYRVSGEKIEVAFPPLDTGKFYSALKEKKEFFREKYGLPGEKKLFLFVSTSHRIKNVRLLQKLFAQLDREDIQLIVAGNPIRESKNIINLGFIKEMEELYAAADFTIHPSRYEAFAQVVAESLQCMTPVIISGKTGARELVAAEEGIIVEDFKLSNWQTAVEKALKRDLSVAPDFADRNGLSVKEHMDHILPPLL